MARKAFLASYPLDKFYELTCNHHPQRWKDYTLPNDSPLRNINNWSNEIHYFNNDNVTASNEIFQLPSDVGGLYVFYLKGPNLPFFENYILYIGRCHITEGQNLRKRALEYQNDKRSTIKQMMETWKENLYYRYYVDSDNDRIDNNEAFLIRAIAPYYNEQIPDSIDIQPTVNAF